jgi:uncharacterized protein (DUF1501 family)
MKTTNTMSVSLSRRQLLQGGSMIAVGLVAPSWLSGVAKADMIRAVKGLGGLKDTVLVVCQLSGGNDGLNTVIPYAQKAYYTLRPNIGIAEDKVLKLDEHIALHPSLAGLHELYKQGKVAVIQNVGYPKPNRSHFRSMEIWQSASPESQLKHGWLGRSFDLMSGEGALDPIAGLGLSSDKPLALQGEHSSIPCFGSLADVQNMLGDADSEKLLRQIQGADAMMGSPTRQVQQASKSALDALSELRKRVTGYENKSKYAEDEFGRGFKQIAQLVATSPATRVVYFSAGSFDTHAKQPDSHPTLLANFGNAINAFQKEMEAIGKADKVLVLTFSEFGRRVQENASLGTDHGAAAPMFLIGSRVKGGLHGPVPDLEHLEDGDVKFTEDFRSVYATTLDQWMGTDSVTVLGQKFEHVAALK